MVPEVLDDPEMREGRPEAGYAGPEVGKVTSVGESLVQHFSSSEMVAEEGEAFMSPQRKTGLL